MTGLVGFTDLRANLSTEILSGMRALLKHESTYVDDQLFFLGGVYGSRSHLGLIDQGRQPFNNSGLISWFEGEFYNQVELKKKYAIQADNDNELLNKLYDQQGDFSFLKEINGYFCAAIYDPKKLRVYLITDRYGFKPVYWSVLNNNLVWSSETKAFLAHKDFSLNIDKDSVDIFFKKGSLTSDLTWFKNVSSLTPASVLQFDLQTSKLTISPYWSFTDIQPVDATNELALAEKLGQIFKNKMGLYFNSKENIGLWLSGGLDSRAILAAIPEDIDQVHAFTFGQKGCDDIRIAKQAAAKRKNVIHHIYELTSSNWLMPRISGIWRSDGQLNLLDMHGIEFAQEIRTSVDFILSGLLGDAILGGSYISRHESLESKFTNRGRRYINQSIVWEESYYLNRKPFFDNDFFDLVLAIPEGLRKNSYIYNKMLLLTFPEYYSDIPWQKSGITITSPAHLQRFFIYKNLLKMRIKNTLHSKNHWNYSDYPSWIRVDPAKTFFTGVLKSPKAIYPDFISKKHVLEKLQKHFLGHDYSYQLCLILTFEIWLQQAYAGRFRDFHDFNE